MTKTELLKRYRELLDEKKMPIINGISNNSNKDQIESAINCLECTDETLGEYLTVIKLKYPAMYKTISTNGDYKRHRYNRYFVYVTARNLLNIA